MTVENTYPYWHQNEAIKFSVKSTGDEICLMKRSPTFMYGITNFQLIAHIEMFKR